MRRKFVRGQFKDADDARRTIASLEHQKTRQRRRCEQLGWLLGFQEKDSLLEAFTLSFFALEHNTHETLAETPGLREAHERFILGRHYETVRGWELEDDSLEKAMKSGVLPEPEERYDYLEQRGGER